MGVLKRLFTSERARLDEDVRSGLAEDYSAERRLANQLRAHAADAPYALAAERLRTLAELSDRQAARLEEEIRRLGGAVVDPDGSPRIARNHWARLVLDLEDVRAAVRRYLEQAIRWEDAHPGLAAVLRELEREEQQHRLWLQDLIARADPQAIN